MKSALFTCEIASSSGRRLPQLPKKHPKKPLGVSPGPVKCTVWRNNKNSTSFLEFLAATKQKHVVHTNEKNSSQLERMMSTRFHDLDLQPANFYAQKANYK